MRRVAFEDATAELDNVAENSYNDPTMFRQDLSLVQMIAPKVEQACVQCVSLTFYQHCSCTRAHVVRTLAMLPHRHSFL